MISESSVAQRSGDKGVVVLHQFLRFYLFSEGPHGARLPCFSSQSLVTSYFTAAPSICIVLSSWCIFHIFAHKYSHNICVFFQCRLSALVPIRIIMVIATFTYGSDVTIFFFFTPLSTDPYMSSVGCNPPTINIRTFTWVLPS